MTAGTKNFIDMKNPLTTLSAWLLLLFFTSVATAGTRAVVQIEVTERDRTDKYFEIITFDDKRFRIDFVGEDRQVTAETPYIMTIDEGATWVIGDKPENMFYCSEVQTEEFFQNLGTQVTRAVEFFNVKAEAPVVKQVLEEPGPDILGFKTTHVRIETEASAYASFLLIKFEYAVKLVDDIWYTTDLEIHPIRQKWLNALTQSGNDIIDQLFNDYVAKLPGPVLKSESVTEVTNVRKKSTKTQKEQTIVLSVEDVSSDELDRLFVKPSCETMDDDEIKEKGKTLFSAGKLAL